MPPKSLNFLPFEIRLNRVEIAVKIMPTCMPLTAKIWEAPAREKSFFTLADNSVLSAMQSALQRAEESVFKKVVKEFPIFSLTFFASVLIVSSSLREKGFIVQEKYPKAMVANRMAMPLKYDFSGGKNVHNNATLKATTMSMSPRLTSVLTNANAIPNTKKISSRKKGSWCKILMGVNKIS